MRLAFLASNRGSAMRVVCQAIADGALAAEAVLVVSNKASSEALAFARERQIPGMAIPMVPDAEGADRALCSALVAAGAELVVLSGYLRKVGPMTLDRFAGRILNTHPALLSKFGGQGMYGRRVHEAVWDAGEAVTGVTIHVVDHEYDRGPILAQRAIQIEGAQDVEAIEQRVLDAEGTFFLETLSRLVRGNLKLPPVPP